MIKRITIYLILIQFVSVSIFAQAENQAEKGAYVVFGHDTLFRIDANLGHFSPGERAQNIIRQIDKVVDEGEAVADSFSIADMGGYSVIAYKDIKIMSVGEADADVQGIPKSELATRRLQQISGAVEKYQNERTPSYWLKKIGFTSLTLLFLVLSIFLVNRLFRWINGKLAAYSKKVKRRRKSVLRYLIPGGPDHLFMFISNIVRLALILILILVFLPMFFSFLPWTEDVVDRFYTYIADPVRYVIFGFLNYLPNLFFIFIIIIFVRYIVRVLTYVSKEIAEERLVLKKFPKDWAKPTLNLAKVIIYIFSLVFIFPYLPGSGSPVFQGVSIFLGVLLSLGSTSAIANIIAGIVITYMRPFVIGDRVKIGDTIGDVVEKTLLVTRLRTPKNEDVTIPNSTIINSQLRNYTRNAKETGIILHPKITIGYDVPSETVIKLLLEAAKNTKDLTREPKPFVLQRSLSDFYVEYELNVYTKQPSKMLYYYSELNQSIQREFNKAGVEILSPHYHSVRDGNPSTIPSGKTEQEATNPVEKFVDKATGKSKGNKK